MDGPARSRTPIIDVHRHCLANPFSTKIGPLMRAILRVAGSIRETPSYSTITVKGITSILYGSWPTSTRKSKRRMKRALPKAC